MTDLGAIGAVAGGLVAGFAGAYSLFGKIVSREVQKAQTKPDVMAKLLEAALARQIGDENGGLKSQFNRLELSISEMRGEIKGITGLCFERHRQIDKDINGLGDKVRELSISEMGK